MGNGQERAKDRMKKSAKMLLFVEVVID